jgi:hypothetical protein
MTAPSLKHKANVLRWLYRNSPKAVVRSLEQGLSLIFKQIQLVIYPQAHKNKSGRTKFAPLTKEKRHSSLGNFMKNSLYKSII